MMPIKPYKKIETIVLYFVIKKNLGVRFQNGPEHETTSLTTIVFNINVHFLQPGVHSKLWYITAFLNIECKK